MSHSDEELEALLAEAKQAYKAGSYEVALKKDLEVAAARPDSLLGLKGMRFAGVCFYRKGELGQSLEILTRAKKLASTLEEIEQAEFIANHRGATLRRMGRPHEALREFTEALERTRSRGLCVSRARLLANLGALYDEAGQRALADECYARCEELLQFIGDQHRLANAHGLMSRVEILRGRLDEAAYHVAREAEFARNSKDKGRIFTSLRHEANLCIARARSKRAANAAADVSELLSLAETHLVEAKELLSRDEIHRKVMVLRASAEIQVLGGRPADALRLLQDSLRSLPADAPEVAAERATVQRQMAEIARSLRLSGEALYYLEESTSTRWKLLEGLEPGNDLVTKLFAPRFDEIRQLADALLDEARTVPRHEAEKERLVALLKRVGDENAEDRVKALEESIAFDLSARDEAKAFWREAVGHDVFAELHSDSRDDLIRSDVVYHGAVADLGRAAHLIVVVFERELRERFLRAAVNLWRSSEWTWRQIEPRNQDAAARYSGLAYKLQDDGPNLGIGTVLQVLELAVAERHPEAEKDYPKALRDLCAASAEPLRDVLRIRSALRAADGEEITAIGVRNRVAHGRYDDRLPTRLDVDAFRRLLLFGDESPLARLTRVRLRFPPQRR